MPRQWRLSPPMTDRFRLSLQFPLPIKESALRCQARLSKCDRLGTFGQTQAKFAALG